MIVAELDGKVVGMCAVAKKGHHKPGEAELQRMSVSPAFRKQGIAKQLVKLIEEFCNDHQYNRLILSTLNSYSGALALYKKCGFKLITTEPFPYKIFQGVEIETHGKDIATRD